MADAGPMIDLCYRHQNPELFGGEWTAPAWVDFASPTTPRVPDTPMVPTWCDACGCDHGPES